MRAVVLTRHGGPEVLEISEIPSPVPGPDEVLVDVFATALNRADVLQRLGMYANPHHEAYEIPGLEFAGVVAAVGSRCRDAAVGDRVMGIVGGGAYAEQLVTHERQLLAVPDDLDLATAAAIPEAFITAWDALVVQGGLTSGRWALIHAGASGVGTAGIEIAKSIGARVAVTCSSGKADICEEVGADLVFERSPHDWLAEAIVNVPDGFDVILDVVGGEELGRNISALAFKGRIIQVGTMAGAQTSINLGALMGKRGTITGTLLRARPLEEKIAITQRFAAEVLPLIAGGRVQPYIDSVVSIDDLAAAHERMEANLNAGKIVVTLR